VVCWLSFPLRDVQKTLPVGGCGQVYASSFLYTEIVETQWKLRDDDEK